MVASACSTLPRVGVAPRVSVVIPTYNRAALLPQCIESVFAQTHPVAEVFVVDDGSTDDTPYVIRELMAAHSSWRGRLHFLQQANQGKSVALNQALAHVTGDWIAFNDSDDLWRPEKLEVQLDTLRAHPDCGACFSNASYSHHYSGRSSEFEGGLELPSRSGRLADSLRVALTNRRIRMQTVIVSARAMESAGRFDPALRVAQDIDFVFRVALVTPFCYVNAPLVEINRDPTHASRLTLQHQLASLTRDRAHEQMLANWQRLLPAAQTDLHRQLARDLRQKRSALANHLLVAGDVPGARAVLRRGLQGQADWRLLVKFGLATAAPGPYVRLLRRTTTLDQS